MNNPYPQRIARCSEHMRQLGIDVLLLTKPSNMFYLTGAGVADLENHLHQVMKDGGHGNHIFGPPIHGVGIEFEEAPLPPGHAFFHGEKAPPPLPENTVISVGNCGLYAGPWGVRVEDTNWVKANGYETLTEYARQLSL